MGIPLRVLIVEDSPADAELTLAELRKCGYDPIYELVDTPEAMKAALQKGDWDIILSDYVMPRFSGPAALKLAQELAPDIPFIMVTGQIGEETAVEAVKAGANDYVLKGNLARLVPAIQRELRDGEVLRERQRTEKERDRLLVELQKAREKLELRVEERSGELVRGNQELRSEIDERKRAEDQIRMTLESIGDGFFAVDGEWRFVYVNMVAERLLGINREEVLGQSLWEIFPLTLGTHLESEYRRAAAGEMRDFENYYLPWGRWFQNVCYPREGGGMSVYFQDITERKRAEIELMRRATAIEEALDAILIADPEMRLITWNKGAVKLYGWSAQEVLGKTTEFLQTRYAGQTRESVVKQILEQGSWSGEAVQKRKDGSEVPVLASATRIQDGDGNLLGFTTVNKDLTEIKKAEEALVQGNRQIAEILESIRDGLLALDRNWRFVYVNYRAAENLGLEPRDLIGQNIWEKLPAIIGTAHETAYRKAMESQEIQRFEMRGVLGMDVWFNITVYPSTEGISVYWQDITELKRAEEKIHRRNAVPDIWR